jgi:hypothetical protein
VNAFNRLVMLTIALLLIGVPVLLLLVGLEVIPNEQVDAYTGYGGALVFLDGLSVSAFDTAAQRTVLGAIGILVALVALLLLLRELTFGRRVDRKAFVDDTPGRETTVTAQAVRHLAEGAAREAGAVSPTCYLASEKNRYHVACNIQVPEDQNFTELATRTQGNIRMILEEQQVPVKDVEITVQGTTSRR